MPAVTRRNDLEPGASHELANQAVDIGIAGLRCLVGTQRLGAGTGIGQDAAQQKTKGGVICSRLLAAVNGSPGCPGDLR